MEKCKIKELVEQFIRGIVFLPLGKDKKLTQAVQAAWGKKGKGKMT